MMLHTMNALVLEELRQDMSYKNIPMPQIEEDEVLIKVNAAALNHRDVYIQQGLYAKIQLPVILGSDLCGQVVQAGKNVQEKWLHQTVVVNPSMHWSAEQKTQSKDYEILGMPANGGFADYLKIKVDQIAPKPEHLSIEEGASLPLAGLTAYRCLFSRAGLQAGEKVFISGIGGGVALFALQFALAIGCEVYVSSSSQEKIDKAIALGAKGGVNYKEQDWHKQVKKMANGGFDVIIDSAGGDGFTYFLDIANMGGRIAFYGGTRGNFTLNPQKIFWKQLSILGSTMGHSGEFKEMIDFVEQNEIHPLIDSIWPMKQGNQAFEHMNKGKQFGKIVLRNH